MGTQSRSGFASRRWRGALALAFGVMLGSSAAWGADSVDAEPFAGAKVRIDGMLKEWTSRFFPLSETVQGSARSGDPYVTAQLGYDEASLYVALKIQDDKIVRSAGAAKSEDHATLTLAFPSAESRYSTHTVELYPGVPGKTAGLVKLDGGAVSGAKIVEAPTRSGLDVEAEIPWSAFAEAARVRVGLRAALSYTDADQPGSVRAVVANTSARAGASLPALHLQAEEGLESSLIRPKGLPEKPSHVAYGNVAGDAMLEQVAIYGDYLTIVGPHYRSGTQFYFGELAGKVTRLSLNDFDGDGLQEVVVQKRLGDGDRYRDVLDVLRLGKNEAPASVFAHEIAIKTPDGEIANSVQIKGRGKSAQIAIAQGTAEGFEAASYNEPTPSDMPGALLPWQTIGTRTFQWQGSGFSVVDEKTVTPKSSPARGAKRHEPDEPPAPPPPRPPTADELLDRLYAMYRQERGLGAQKPRFDFVTDVAADSQPERVLVHGKDIVVFGKGFRGGTTYAFITIGVADPKDVLDVTARDLTGDGKAEIIVRGVLHAKASKALGGDVVDRQAFFVYRVGDAALARVFAAETGRALGDKRIIGAMRMTRAGRGLEIELAPGRAVGWTEQTYPFPPDTTAAGGLEPLLLPWGENAPRRYHFDGASFAQQ